MGILLTTELTDGPLLQLAESVARDGLPADIRVIQNVRNIVASTDTPAGPVNIKAFRCPRLINSYVYTTLRRSKAARSYDFARRLIALGFNTPEPLAAIEERSAGRLRRSYYLSRQIEAEEIRYTEQRPDEHPLLEALGREMARLHKAGVLMHDFSPGNILVNTDAATTGRYTFSYVDLNRMEFGVTDRSRLMQMFGPIVVYPYQAELIARAYAEAMGLTGADAESTVAGAVAVLNRFRNRLKRKRRLKSILMPWKKKYRS